jgi:hypothetical protein
MNQEQYDAALATLTAELESASEERVKEKITDAIQNLKQFTVETPAVEE